MRVLQSRHTKYTLNRHTRTALFVGFSVLIGLFIAFGFSQERWLDIDARKADSLRWRLSMSFAYSSLIMLAVTLSIGSVNLLRHRSNPVHNALRRAFGVGTALFALMHLMIAITIHWDGWALWWQFIRLNDAGLPITLRLDEHGIANNIGLALAGILTCLVGLSTNRAIKGLGLHRWKRAQQFVYISAILMFIHGLLYQNIEARSLVIRSAFIIIFAYVIIMQSIGIWVRLNVNKNQKNTVSLAESES